MISINIEQNYVIDGYGNPNPLAGQQQTMTLTTANAGDSPIYVYRANQLIRIHQEHSLRHKHGEPEIGMTNFVNDGNGQELQRLQHSVNLGNASWHCKNGHYIVFGPNGEGLNCTRTLGDNMSKIVHNPGTDAQSTFPNYCSGGKLEFKFYFRK